MTENPESSSPTVTRVVALAARGRHRHRRRVRADHQSQLLVRRGHGVPGHKSSSPSSPRDKRSITTEQALPYGVYAIFKALVSVVGLNETILRIPVLLAYVGGVAALWWATRSLTGLFGRAAAILAGGLGMWVVLEAAMFKAYIFRNTRSRRSSSLSAGI